MSNQIKPIETQYNGFRFRSRLEARWAVFFDTLRVKYEYEKEGFELDPAPFTDGVGKVHYLPDFWLPEQRMWVEVKGQEPDPNGPEWDKCVRLAHASGQPVFLVWGEMAAPMHEKGWPRRWLLFVRRDGLVRNPETEQLEPSSDVYSPDEVWWVECVFCGRIGVGARGDADDLPCGCWRARTAGIALYAAGGYTPRLIDAYAVARSARFEFGESGAPR